MSRTELEPVVDRARRAADAAARRAGVAVSELLDLDGQQQLSRMFDRIWDVDGPPLVPLPLMRALSHAGNFLAGAFAGGRLVGGTLGFFARDADGTVYIHSHMTGIDPDRQKRGAGLALKMRQRAWALERGITQIRWTFDPLVRSNAYFNIARLGCEVVAYMDNFYGAMPDGHNRDDESDRCLATWQLASERTVRAVEEGLEEPDVKLLVARGAVRALSVDGSEAPETSQAAGEPILCRVPADIVALRWRDAELARRWRLALRLVMGRALRTGYTATGFTRDGWYVLEKHRDRRT